MQDPIVDDGFVVHHVGMPPGEFMLTGMDVLTLQVLLTDRFPGMQTHKTLLMNVVFF